MGSLSQSIRPGPREVMELQRRCREECQPYFDLMAREISMDIRVCYIIKKDGTLEKMPQEESATTKHLRAVVDGIIKRYTAMALGEDPAARNAAEPTNL